MELRLSLTQKLCQRQELTQRLVIGQLFTLRLALIQELRSEQYRPRAECPECGRKLTPGEIIQGFNDDPRDFTTCCTGCGRRFEPKLICFADGARVELPFFCNSQMLEQLRGKELLSPKQLARRHPAIYRSAIVHHGGISQAFKEIGINYQFEEIPNWQAKVEPFLGRLPDGMIARCVDVSPSVIRRMRQKQGIGPYTRRKLSAEVTT